MHRHVDAALSIHILQVKEGRKEGIAGREEGRKEGRKERQK
jgi:hypothetical protein